MMVTILLVERVWLFVFLVEQVLPLLHHSLGRRFLGIGHAFGSFLPFIIIEEIPPSLRQFTVLVIEEIG
jgi:hypothetical protein